MKRIFPLGFVVLLLLAVSCSSDEASSQNDLSNVRAQFCNDFQGPAAAYWNLANGIFVPMPDFPVIADPGGQITHNLQPLLSLTYPQGYSGSLITDSQTSTLGLDIKRNDNGVFFRWIPNSTLFGLGDFDPIMAREVNTMFANYGFNGDYEVVCTRNESQNFEGLVENFNARLIRFGAITGLVWIRTVYFPATASFNSAIQISAAPTAEFDAVTMQTFLPFNYQLHVRPDGGGFIDNDGDGTPAHLDPDDNDPTVR